MFDVGVESDGKNVERCVGADDTEPTVVAAAAFGTEGGSGAQEADQQRGDQPHHPVHLPPLLSPLSITESPY